MQASLSCKIEVHLDIDYATGRDPGQSSSLVLAVVATVGAGVGAAVGGAVVEGAVVGAAVTVGVEAAVVVAHASRCALCGVLNDLQKRQVLVPPKQPTPPPLGHDGESSPQIPTALSPDET